MIGYTRASVLDPVFMDAKHKLQLLTEHLAQSTELTSTKGKLRNKKILSMVSSLDTKAYLDPLKGQTKDKALTIEPVLFDKLRVGSNEGKAVIGAVACSISAGCNSVCFTFCLVDKSTTCHRVSVYNMSSGWGVKIGDIVTVRDPYLNDVNFDFNGQSFRFSSIRVENPLMLLINGRRLNKDSLAPCTLSLEARSE